MKNIAIILASGSGERAGLNIPKQFALIKNKTILELSIDVFEQHECIDEIIIVSNPFFIDKTNEIVKSSNYNKVSKVVPGGKTRQESSYNGVYSVTEPEANILIHDAVRPFITKEIISNCITALNEYSAVNVAIESSDTIIQVDENNIIKSVPNRMYLRRCQTPQCFKLSLIKKAHKLAKDDCINTITDDCGLILKYNLADIFVVSGSTDNIKITYPQDLEIANLIMNRG